MTPTNTDLAAALREIADTLPIGSALIVRLAADRLGNEWIEWDATAPNADDGPDTGDSPIDVRLRNGVEYLNDGDDKHAYSWCEVGDNTVTHYRLSRT